MTIILTCRGYAPDCFVGKWLWDSYFQNPSQDPYLQGSRLEECPENLATLTSTTMRFMEKIITELSLDTHLVNGPRPF